MKKYEWLQSLRDGNTSGSFVLSDRSSRARRALLFVSTLQIAIHSFDIEIKAIPAVGVDFSSEPQTVKIVLMLSALFFLVSFVFLSWADFNDRPTPAFRKKVFGIWSHNFQVLQIIYRVQFMDLLRPHRRKISDAEISVTEERDPIFFTDSGLILDENSNARVDQFLEIVEEKVGPIFSDDEKSKIKGIVKNWWNKCRNEYRWTLLRYYKFGAVYSIGAYLLQIIFPVIWGVIALFAPDLSWVHNFRNI